MEDLDQAYGYILYRTSLKPQPGGDLVLDELHDYAQVYLDGKLIGTLDRRLNQDHLTLPATTHPARLDILVENTGRVNFAKVIRGERNGITRQVTLAGQPCSDWYDLSAADDDLTALKFIYPNAHAPAPASIAPASIVDATGRHLPRH